MRNAACALLALLAMALTADAACTAFNYTTPSNFLNHTKISNKASKVRVFTQGFGATAANINIATAQNSDDLVVSLTGSYDPVAFGFQTSTIFNFTVQDYTKYFDVFATFSAVSSASSPSSSLLLNSAAAAGAAALAGTTPKSRLASACVLASALVGYANAVTADCPVTVQINITMPTNYTLVSAVSPLVSSFYYTVQSITATPTKSPVLPTTAPSFAPTRSPA